MAPLPASSLPFCVVDASVVIKLYLAEPGSPLARALLLHASGGPSSRAAPDFLYLECANILWKRVQGKSLLPGEAREHLADLRAQPLRIWPAADLVEEALDLALRFGVTAYDASYLALATLLNVPFVSADLRLLRAAGGPNSMLIRLESLTI